MDCLEIAPMAKIWHIILVRFNNTNKTFQDVDVDLKMVVDLIDSHEKIQKSLRNRYAEFELYAMNSCGNTDYKSTTSKPRKRNKRYDIKPTSVLEEVVFSPEEKFKCKTFNVILDQLSTALQHRQVAYQAVYDRFKLVVTLCTLSDAEIKTEAEKFFMHSL